MLRFILTTSTKRLQRALFLRSHKLRDWPCHITRINDINDTNGPDTSLLWEPRRENDHRWIAGSTLGRKFARLRATLTSGVFVSIRNDGRPRLFKPSRSQLNNRENRKWRNIERQCVFLRFLITKLLSAFVCGWEGFEDRAKMSIIYRLSRFKFAQIWDKARKLKIWSSFFVCSSFLWNYSLYMQVHIMFLRYSENRENLITLLIEFEKDPLLVSGNEGVS